MPSVISKDKTKITYESHGKGPLVIQVLGALNKRGRGKKLTDLLKNKFTVVSYDRRGRGDSNDTSPYAINKEVNDIEAIINELGGKAFLYGHSSGGILALYAAEKLDSKVSGIALYEIPYNHDSNALNVFSEYKKKLNQLLNTNDSDGAVSLFVKSVGVSEKQIDAMKNLPMWKGLTSMALTLRYDTIELMEQYPKIDFKKISTPTLVMYGGASPEFMKITASKLCANLSNANLESLEKQTHDVKPIVLAPKLIEFFNKFSSR